MQPTNPFLRHSGISVPIICGPMYPCSNPELIAAVSNSGAIGIVQPISLTAIYGYDFQEGLRYIKSLTQNPIGMNALIEKSSTRYIKKMEQWIDIALEEGVRFFITSLGNPDWVVQKVHAKGGIVYHDVTEAKWADIAINANVDGLIAVNNAAGGHSGTKDSVTLFQELKRYQLPIICAGGIGDSKAYQEALMLGYDGVQMGTRFIASTECSVPKAYKTAIVKALKKDIILTKGLTGIPLSVIDNHTNRFKDLQDNIFYRWLYRKKFFKKLFRLFFSLKALKNGQDTMQNRSTSKQLWVAGKSVEGIHSIQTVAKIIKSFQSHELS